MKGRLSHESHYDRFPFVRCVTIGLLLTLVSRAPQVAAQTVGVDSLESFDLQGVVEQLGDSSILEERDTLCLLNDCPTHRSKFRYVAGFSHRDQPSSRPSNPLGSSFSSWATISIVPFLKWKAHFSMKKDANEPSFWALDSPWFLFESKRFSLSRTGTRFSLIVGDFKVVHGSGVFSGNGWKPIVSWSSPTRLVGTVARLKATASTGTTASRRGIATEIMIASPVRLGAYGFRTAFSASTEVGTDAGEQDVLTVKDISNTYAFTSKASLSRRKKLAVKGIGGYLNVSTPSFQSSILIEGLSFSSRHPISFSNHQIGVSGYLKKNWGPVSFLSEAALIKDAISSWNIGVRIISQAAGNIKLMISRKVQGPNWPYGSRVSIKTPSALQFDLFFRSKSNRHGIFSLGITTSSTRDPITFAAQRLFKVQAYHEWNPSENLSIRSIIRRKLKVNLSPIHIAPGTEGSSVRALNTYLQFLVVQRLGSSVTLKLSPSVLTDSALDTRLYLLSSQIKFTSSRWTVLSVLAISKQADNAVSRIQGYYADSALSGRFPVASLSGSSSGFSVLFQYKWRRSQIELMLKETVRAVSLMDLSNDTRSIQIQLKRQL